jgi:hypothetical protein
VQPSREPPVGVMPSSVRIRVGPGLDAHQELLRAFYEDHGFKMGALLALVDCQRRDLPVPPWLRRYLADGVERHIGPAGASLDQTIGLVGREGRRKGNTEFFRWTSLSHAVALVHRMRGEENPDTGSKYGVRGACRVLAAVGKSAGLSARSLETTYRKRRREFA